MTRNAGFWPCGMRHSISIVTLYTDWRGCPSDSDPVSRIPVSGGILDETDFFCAIEAKLFIRGQRGLKVEKLCVIFIRTAAALEKE